jgi:hypothetical protein
LYADARDFFNAARRASKDAAAITRQLDTLENRALGMGGGGFDPRVRSTPAHDRMGMAVAALVDRETKLRAQLEADYALIDKACALLYGTDNERGLRSLVEWPADALFYHYLALLTWNETANRLGYSTSYVRYQANAALDFVDANGAMWTELGIGFAT